VGVGLRLRPDLRGKGLGHGFLVAELGFLRRSFCPEVFRLSVATFNERAIKVYEGVGFVQGQTYRHETKGGVYEFLEMERRAQAPAEPRHEHSQKTTNSLFSPYSSNVVEGGFYEVSMCCPSHRLGLWAILNVLDW
jgi:hypothetical protein